MQTLITSAAILWSLAVLFSWRSLLSDSYSLALVGACLVALVIATASRWNRVARAPGLGGTVALAIVALVVMAGSFTSQHWLVAAGLVIGCFPFLNAITDSRDVSLASLAWLLVPPASLIIQQDLAPGLSVISHILEHAHNALRWLSVPHVVIGNEIATASGRIMLPAEQSFFLKWEWVAFFGITYSLFLGRNWLETGANMLLAILWWYLGLLSWIVLGAWLAESGRSIHPTLLILGVALFAILLFLSTTRAFRCIVSPIDDTRTDARQANPLVILWNRLGQPKPEVAAQQPHAIAMCASAICALLAQVAFSLV